MNIVMFTDAYYPRVNGVAVSVKSYAEELARLGHRVCIVCPDYNSNYVDEYDKDTFFKHFFYEYAPYGDKNLELLRIPSDKLLWSHEDRAVRLNQWHTVKEQVDKFKPDVVHVNSEFVMGWYGVAYARHAHIALVFTFHTLWEDYLENYLHMIPSAFSQKIGRDLVKFYLKRADEIIVPTERIKSVIKRYGIDRPSDILPTGIPSKIVDYDEKKALDFNEKFFSEFPLLKDKRILLFVGRIVKEKNLSFLFPIITRVVKSFPDVALLFVGGGPELEHLKNEAKKIDMDESIFFTDYRPREELVYFYHLSSVFVFPSLTETQGLVTVEAMMTGLPVVAIAEMGTLDVMQGDNGGFMVKNDEKLFADKVIQLLTDKELYAKKSKEAKEWGNKWSMKSLTPQLVKLFEKGIKIKKEKVL